MNSCSLDLNYLFFYASAIVVIIGFACWIILLNKKKYRNFIVLITMIISMVIFALFLFRSCPSIVSSATTIDNKIYQKFYDKNTKDDLFSIIARLNSKITKNSEDKTNEEITKEVTNLKDEIKENQLNRPSNENKKNSTKDNAINKENQNFNKNSQNIDTGKKEVSLKRRNVVAPNHNALPNDLRGNILRLINNHRSSIGLSPLNWNNSLAESAHKCSEENVKNNLTNAINKISLSHTASCMYPLSKPPYSAGGQNLVWDYGDNASTFFNDWMNSVPHRMIIEDRTYGFNMAGIGIATDRFGYKIITLNVAR
jgi:cysteine-rich secretory protein family